MKKALIVVDMSNDFVHDNGGLTAGKPAQEIVPYILEKAQEFYDNGDVVIFTMDAHKENDPHFELWPAHNVVGTWGQELYGDLKNWYDEHKFQGDLDEEDDTMHPVKYIPKTNYNAFYETYLAHDLNVLNVEEVHVVGVCTDICDFLTVAGADAAGFKTAVHKRGCATFTSNGNLFIDQMKLCFHTQIIE